LKSTKKKEDVFAVQGTEGSFMGGRLSGGKVGLRPHTTPREEKSPERLREGGSRNSSKRFCRQFEGG